jgi:phosphate transport system permease protein
LRAVASRATLTRTLRVPGRGGAQARRGGRFGDRMLFAVCALAALLVGLTLLDVAYQLITNARLSISHFGLGFLAHTTWNPAPRFNVYGAAALIYGTVVSSLCALVLATPLGIAIALYLSMMAAPRVRAVVGPLVEMLAAIPSIILGFWGFLVLAPFVEKHIEPALHSALGFIPLFGAPQSTGLSLFTAGLILSLMILPIIASISRDLFLTVPKELKEGAEALGATRWEVIRGVVLPTTASGVVAATLLGLGRALGEAIAVSLVVGGLTQIHGSLFQSGSTLAGMIANQFPSITTNLHQASLFYLAVVLLAIGLLTSLAARLIARRFDVYTTLVTT